MNFRDLDATFRKNFKDTLYIGWQYFGSKYGVMRTYPGLHQKSPIDPRYRPWSVPQFKRLERFGTFVTSSYLIQLSH